MRPGYGKYVGRVGALAVALGISGVGVALPGMAWADDTSPPNSASTSSSDSSSESPSSEPASEPSPGSPDGADQPGTPQSEDQDAGTDSEPATEETPDAGDDEPVSSAPKPRRARTTSEARAGERDTDGIVKSRVQEQADGEANGEQAGTAGGGALPRDNTDNTETTDITETASDDDSTAISSATTISATSTATSLEKLPGHTLQPSATGTPRRQLETPAPNAILGAVATFLGVNHESPQGPSPSSPADSPLMMALLGWASRRESVAAVEQSPTATAQASAQASAQGLPAEFERVVLVSGLDEPTDIQILTDGRILIAQRNGTVMIYEEHDGTGHLHDVPVISVPTRSDGERGLLGIEVDPEFDETGGWLYLSYTTADNFDRLSRVQVTGNTAALSSEEVLIQSTQAANNIHHGGEIRFGPDGLLYWSTGDNLNSPNPQSLNNIHGKILRLDMSRPEADYVPADNPFVDQPDANPYIYAYGLRNPFRFTFTDNGKLLAADVGGARWEELNVIQPGANYGWPTAEGICTGCGFANPIYTYAHTEPPAVAGSITGVVMYTGSAFGPEYQNKVFIADYTLGWMKVLTFDSEFESFISEEMFDDQAGTTVKLEEGLDGNLYQLNIYPGELAIIRPAVGNRAPTAVITATPDNGLGPLEVEFSSAGSSDPEGSALSFSWDFGDGNTSAAPNPTWTYTTNGTFDVALTVSDGERTSTTIQRIVVGNRAPVVTIDPDMATNYNAGDTIDFSAVATDPDSDPLTYSWRIDFHHADHIHPFLDNIGGQSGSFTIPRTPDNIDTTWYRVAVTVTDSAGLSTTEYVDVKPNLVDLTITANDPAAVFTVDGVPYTGSYTTKAVVGVQRVIAALPSQTIDGRQVVFNNWSDGQDLSHTISTPGTATTYTVSYVDYVDPGSLDPLALLSQLRDNAVADVTRIVDAVNTAGTALASALGSLPDTLGEAIEAIVADPARLGTVVSELFDKLGDDVTAVVTPVVRAVGDVVSTNVRRTVGALSAVAANIAPIAQAVIDAPAGVGRSIQQSVELLVRVITAWDLWGIIGALQYAQAVIPGEIQAQATKIAITVVVLFNDVLDALSVPLPPVAQPSEANARTS
ncbi:PQQ-dependent sugar dehydrogenase [Mycolicibacterium mengxianglii]|uniref:PQQ-dependent sugar dehydrogenase n=1 Tax=Mycolicibacterium mengxianglii TaxID=2736649 RepID=UPI001E4037D9|nr:PQQ-dependent sugar dehydrogenase [Mycolicibacterium mengxianglii]